MTPSTAPPRANSGLGVPCAEAQADGVPCPEIDTDCAICGHAAPCAHDPVERAADAGVVPRATATADRHRER